MIRYFIIILLFACSAARASVPEAIKYQAVVRDNSGNVISNKPIGIRISILKSSVSGTAVYVETHLAVSNSQGLINFEIGNGSPVSGAMSNILWGDDSYFIKLEMDENGGTNYTLIGTSQLVSVPYSLYAKNAGNGTQWRDTSANIYYNTGKVGVGTNNPKAPFEVRSTSRTTNNILITGDIPTIKFADTAYTGNGVVVGVAADTNNLIRGSSKGDLVFTNEAYGTGGGYILGTGIPSSSCLKITDDCKIGIGVNTPLSKVEVKGGDINVLDIGAGVIMKSPNGQCWKLTVSNAGTSILTSVSCTTGAIINDSSNAFGAVAAYNFSGNANDASSHSHNGFAVNVTLVSDRRGNPNSAYNFSSASGSYVELPTYQQILGSSEEFSISMWLKYSGVDAGPTPLQLYPDNPTDRLYVAVPYHPTSNPADIYFDYGNFTTGRLNLTITTFNIWKHFVFVRSKASNFMKVYVDGVLLGSKSSTVDITNKNRKFRIGGAGLGTETFNGAIDDIRIFDRALSDADVSIIYNSEK
jgi:hypothetical protein